MRSSASLATTRIPLSGTLKVAFILRSARTCCRAWRRASAALCHVLKLPTLRAPHGGPTEHLRAGAIDLGILALPVDQEGLESASSSREPFASRFPRITASHRARRSSPLIWTTPTSVARGRACLRDQA